MNAIDEKVLKGINPLVEFLGAERAEDLKDKIAQIILNKVEEELNACFEQVYLVDPDKLTDFGDEALETVKDKIKQKLEAKYLALAEEAISKIHIKE